MRYIIGFIMCSLIYMPVSASAIVNSVQTLEWDYRIILFRTNTNPSNEVSQLRAEEVEINDRDILWFVFYNNEVVTNLDSKVSQNFVDEIFQYYTVDIPQVVLLGRDGGIKDKAPQLELQRLFALIDTMPMRQMEMAR